MTQTSVSNAIVSAMLSWLKGLASWVLKLFNLAGSGGSPLAWLSQNWLKLLALLLLIGVAMDFLIWMIRWRPYWVWMRRKRIVVNDERLLRDDSSRDDLFECSYVVPNAAKRPQRRRTEALIPERRWPKNANDRVVRAPQRDIFSDALFEVGDSREGRTDMFEDEVFDVSNLPESQRAAKHRVRKRRK